MSNKLNFADLIHINHISGRRLLILLILVIFCITTAFLSLYVQWLRRCRNLPVTTTVTPTSSGPHGLSHAPSLGLDAKAINGLPIILHGSLVTGTGAGEEPECCICLSLFKNDERVKVLPDCKHFFHSDCVDSWLSNNSSCPLCRASLLVRSLDDSDIP